MATPVFDQDPGVQQLLVPLPNGEPAEISIFVLGSRTKKFKDSQVSPKLPPDLLHLQQDIQRNLWFARGRARNPFNL